MSPDRAGESEDEGRKGTHRSRPNPNPAQSIFLCMGTESNDARGGRGEGCDWGGRSRLGGSNAVELSSSLANLWILFLQNQRMTC